jgi:20S proteasome alpha/beta subunit
MQTIKEQYHTSMSLEEAEKMILQTLKAVMEESISKDNVEVMIIRSETRKIESKTPAQLEAVIGTLS